MANFLISGESEVADQDAQAAQTGDNQRLKDMAANALVSQYGNQAADPEMWNGDVAANKNAQMSPIDVASAQNTLQQTQLAQRREAELRAAQGVQAAIQQGKDPGDAYDQIVGPNAAALGLSPTDSATMRDHIVKNPQNIDGIVASLAGSPKPEGLPVMYTKADGTQGAAYITDRGTTDQLELPQGANIKGKVTGAPIQVDMGGGKYALVQHDQYGNLTATDINGTPISGETAQAAIARAKAMQQNADTNSYSAGVRSNNTEFGAPAGTAPGASGGGVNGAIIGQESRGNPNAATSVDGAVGVGQVTPGFFKQFAHPGENINNPADNLAVANRGIDYYKQQYGGDPARVAVAYFSGPDNVAPPGSKTPYIHDFKDGNGKATSSYVSDVLGRMGGGSPSAQPAPAAAASDTAPAPGNGPLFNRLPPKGRQAAVAQAAGIVNGADQLTLADQQIDRVIQSAKNPMATGLGQIAGDVPGLPAYDMKAQTKQLQSLGLTDWIQSLKNAGGSTGIGRVLQSEANAAMSAYGNLDPGQDHDQFIQHVQMFQHRIHQLQNTAQAAYKQQWGVDAYTAAGRPPQATGGSNAHLSDQDLLAKYGVH